MKKTQEEMLDLLDDGELVWIDAVQREFIYGEWYLSEDPDDTKPMLSVSYRYPSFSQRVSFAIGIDTTKTIADVRRLIDEVEKQMSSKLAI